MSELAEPPTIEILKERLGDCILEAQETSGEIRIEATAQGLRELSFFLRDELGFDYPADLTAYDTGEEFVLWYRLYNMAENRTAIIHVRLNRENPVAPSVVDIWPGVNWHERECFDLFGIQFTGHPDQSDPERMRILLPEDWEGHPFRKDYEPVFSHDPLHGPQETN